MNDTMLIKEAAALWGLTERRVSDLCLKGRIEGAKKDGHIWLIPTDARKPVDQRIKSGAYIKNKKPDNLPLPIGVSDYRLAQSKYYYIDKTLMIRDFLDELPIVSLFTRPRRFGKTLNMDMLRTFFEKTDEDTSVYFKDKLIWNCGKKYRDHQGKYPVIFVSFKDIKKETWKETYHNISQLIILEFKRHSELAESDKVTDKQYYQKIVREQANQNEFEMSFFMLSKMLHDHYGTPAIIIIDEYDTPIQQGHAKGFYDEVILFMRNLFSGGLKDNRHLSYGFLTGILRVAKESIFSGLNNLVIHSVLDQKYGAYFGFTSDEVKKMAEYYHAEDKYDEIREWYDGYRFGNTEIFNPWSVINYFSNHCQPRAFWQATGSNEIIGEILSDADAEIYARLSSLLQGGSFLTYIDTSVIYPQIKNNPSSIYSFLLVAGYLKAIRSELSFTGDFMCEVALPNKEVSLVYNKEVLQKLSAIVSPSAAASIQEALCLCDAGLLKKQLETLLIQSASFYDTIGENFYHGLMLGLCAALSSKYYVTSNRESGDGRYDIQLMPKEPDMPGILIELKMGKKSTDLKKLANTALQQIADRKYDTELTAHGIHTIYRFGVAFSGKKVEIAVI